MDKNLPDLIHNSELNLIPISSPSAKLAEMGDKFASFVLQTDSIRESKEAFFLAKEAYNAAADHKQMEGSSLDSVKLAQLYLSTVRGRVKRSDLYTGYTAVCSRFSLPPSKKSEFFELATATLGVKPIKTGGEILYIVR